MRCPTLTLLLVLVTWGWTIPTRGDTSETASDDHDGLRRSPIVIAIERAGPSVVDIRGNKILPAGTDSGEGTEGPRKVNGMGTGIIIDARGYILTNHHVVDGVRPIQVTLNDGSTFAARIVAHDARTDLAVIKIKATSDLPILPIGTSSDLMLGETVVAVGNAFGYQHTVTRGIISALHRTVEVTETQDYYDLIQTDASINPGNSGGPLLNVRGELVGINVAVRVNAQGIAFAIPVDKAMEIAAELIAAEQSTGIWHGIEGTTDHQSGTCRFVASRVEPESPADQAGIRSGDCIRLVNEIPIARQLDIERAFLGTAPGKSLPIVVDRPGQGETSTELVLQRSQRGATRKSSDIARGNEVDRLAWSRLGIRVAQVSAEQLPATRERFNDGVINGGLKITAIRQEGAAAELGIQVGDILIGMHGRETATMDHLDWVLTCGEFDDQEGEFLVIRERKIFVGQLRLARR